MDICLNFERILFGSFLETTDPVIGRLFFKLVDLSNCSNDDFQVFLLSVTPGDHRPSL